MSFLMFCCVVSWFVMVLKCFWVSLFLGAFLGMICYLLASIGAALQEMS